MMGEFASAAVAAAGRRALACHYRSDGQLAFILPDMDRDGASLFCLGLSGILGEGSWRVSGKEACVEIAFGLAAYSGGSGPGGGPGPESAAEAILAEAESVLALSKRAYAEHGGACP
jgi:hypothetical protein